MNGAGFTHGVLNTDNMSRWPGESSTNGPFAFLETWDPASTAAYFDQNGLYVPTASKAADLLEPAAGAGSPCDAAARLNW